jgi:small basic protein (TIGR04137 family)
MSQHPSLRSSENDKKQRSVLKRYERISLLKDREKWKDDDSVFGLPKVKIVKFKVKKEKVAAETAEGAAAPAKLYALRQAQGLSRAKPRGAL